MIIALDKYTVYIFTSLPNCMMSSSVAMETLCITNIGTQIVIFFIENLQKYLKCTEKHFVKVQISIDIENEIMQSRELDGK